MAKTTIPVELSSTPGITDNSNATAITIDANEKVGIGTSPAQTLHVNSGTSNVVARFESSDSVAVASFKDNNGEAEIGNVGNDIGFFPAGAEKVRISQAGNLMVGATSFNTGAFGSAGGINVAHTQPIILLHETDTDKDSYIGMSASTMFIGTADAIPMRFSTSDTERLRIDSSGRVGLGTTSPTGSLHITNKDDGGSDVNVHIQNTTANRLAGLKLLDENGTVHGVFRYDNGGNNASLGVGTGSPSAPLHVVGNAVITGNIISTGDTNIIYDSDDDCIFSRANGNETMRLDSDGNFLVGKTSAGLGYNGLAVTPNDYMGYTNGSTDSGDRCLVLNRQQISSGSADLLSFRTQNSDKGIVSFNGSAMVYGGTSDYRLKENIKPIENGLDRLNQLNPVSFDWKETGIKSEGFIAHEVQEIFTDAVSGEKDGKYMQQLDYGRITPLLVKAIQEQQTIIDDLKSRIETLEG